MEGKFSIQLDDGVWDQSCRDKYKYSMDVYLAVGEAQVYTEKGMK